MLTAMQEQVHSAQSTAANGRSFKCLVLLLLAVFAVLILAVAAVWEMALTGMMR
jgi:hypothetical protein